MKLWPAISLALLLASCALLLWSSNSFDQTSTISFPLTKFQKAKFQKDKFNQDSIHLDVPLPMTFAHADHVKQQCVTCHHNYQDDTGQGLCLDCHRRDQDIAFKMRDQFHGLCMTCHIEKRIEGEHSGPLRNCKACHTLDHAP